MLKEIMGQSENIKNCDLYNEQKINELATIINDFKPQNIIIVGRGTSLHAGTFAKYLFEIYYHIPVSIASQSVFTIYDSNVDMSKSLVIGISQSGGGIDTLTVLKKANAQGALTIGIVNELDSILAKEVKHILYCNADKAVSFAATKTFTTSMYLITKLVYALTKHEDLNVSLDDIVNAIENGMTYHNQIKEEVQTFKNCDDIYVLGRGLALSLAMETALKIKETCHIPVDSYPISEFYHGPIVTIRPDIPIILFGLDEETNGNVKEILERFKTNNIFTFLISNNPDLSAIANKSIIVNNKQKICTIFTAIIILQLFTCELSVLRGSNPDFNEGLLNIKTI